jgi:hypothetical protein
MSISLRELNSVVVSEVAPSIQPIAGARLHFSGFWESPTSIDAVGDLCAIWEGGVGLSEKVRISGSDAMLLSDKEAMIAAARDAILHAYAKLKARADAMGEAAA